MVVNESRRELLADSALAVLGSEGSRGLTHRAVDARAGVPAGTTANYFPSRAALFTGMGGRIFDRVAPEPDRLADLAQREPDHETFIAYTRYIVERLLRAPELALALCELRLETARNPSLAEEMGAFLRLGLASDIRFSNERGLPAGRAEITMLHYAIDGLVLDRLTTPISPDDDPLATIEEITRRIVQLHHVRGS